MGGAIYWYFKPDSITMVGSLQTIALDNFTVDSFDDVCTKEDNNQLSCTGNVAKFGCDKYIQVSEVIATGFEPHYPIIGCQKEDDEIGVYVIKQSYWPFGVAAAIDYLIIKDGLFQLIQTEDHFQDLFLPVEDANEALAYFDALDKGVLVLDDEQLKRIQSPKFLGGETDGDRFLVSTDAISLSQVTSTTDGYVITAYSGIPKICVDEVYFYTFLLKRDGLLIEQNKELIWEMLNKPSCIN